MNDPLNLSCCVESRVGHGCFVILYSYDFNIIGNVLFCSTRQYYTYRLFFFSNKFIIIIIIREENYKFQNDNLI